MRVLILGTDYAPDQIGIAPFNTGLATQLAASGGSVTMVTTFAHYPDYRWRGKVGWRATEILDGVEVRRLRGILPRRPNALWRMVWDSSFALAAFIGGCSAQRPDVVICTSPPIQTGLAAGLLARLWRVPMILWIQDLPIETAISLGMLSATSPAVGLGRALERMVYRLADDIVVVHESFARRLDDQVPQGKSVVVIPNWGDPQVDGRPDPEVRRGMGAEASDFLVLHAGNMGEKQALSNVLEAARIANGDATFKVALVGDGQQRKLLQQRLTEQSITNVRILPLQPAEKLPGILASADLLLLNQSAELVDGVAPSKLITYMAAGRPVVAAAHPGSAAARLVNDAGCGVVVSPEDPTALAAAIDDLRRDPSRIEMGEAGRRYFKAHFERDVVMKRWEQVLAQSQEAR